MRLYPAIDIKDGKCVRLTQGKFDNVEVFSDNPADMAEKWQDLGAEYIHLVDLDGARYGGAYNNEVIERIAKRVSVPVQVGGGIRSIKDIEDKFDAGVTRVILGTSAVKDKEFLKKSVDKYGDRIAVGIDAKDGKVALSGWEEISSVDALELCEEMRDIGVKTVIFTDISRDGMMSGPNYESTKKLIGLTGIDVIASGGVSSYDDLLRIKELGAEGAIIGKALYLGNIELDKAIELCNTAADFSYLKFNDAGLITVVTQDYENKDVLMVAYMNREALARTQETGKVHYYSRSRKKLWLKGETSGHFQYVKQISFDCDADALLVIAEQIGAACHTGERSCFYRNVSGGRDKD